jgi:hypothetical protein
VSAYTGSSELLILLTALNLGGLRVIKAFLNTFKKLPQEVVDRRFLVDERVLEYGVAAPRVKKQFQNEFSVALNDLYLATNDFNQAFHKSWQIIADTPQVDLWRQAIAHYLTTYGFDTLGIEDGYIYIPNESLDLPELTKFVPIGVIDKKTALDFVEETLQSGIALRQETIADLFKVLAFYKTPVDIGKIKNKEARTIAAYLSGVLPESPEEIIRAMNYALTGSTLLIKSPQAIAVWGRGCDDKKDAAAFIEKCLQNCQVELAEVFYRYKPLLLSLRNYAWAKPLVNKIRRLAKTHHQPKAPQDFVITRALNNKDYNLDSLNIFNLIKVYNKANYLANSKLGFDSFVVRNGKIFSPPFKKDLTKKQLVSLRKLTKQIKAEITKRLGKKSVVLPDGWDVTLPDSEKSFIGDIPIGTSIAVPRESASVIGISWKNDENGGRTDLDLSALMLNGEKYGWNARYKDADLDLLYSGDMTTEGSEAFYIQHLNQPVLLTVNCYNTEKATYHLFIGHQELNAFRESGESYVIDPNQVVFQTKLNTIQRQESIGFITDDTVFNKRRRFTFYRVGTGTARVSRGDELSNRLLSVFFEKTDSMLKVSDVFTVVDKAKGKVCKADVIDLSKLSKEAVLSLVKLSV